MSLEQRETLRKLHSASIDACEQAVTSEHQDDHKAWAEAQRAYFDYLEATA